MGQAELERQLRETGSYDTPADCRRAVADRLLGWSDLWFQLKVMRVVWRSHVVVRSGRFDFTAWAGLSYGVFHAVEACGGIIHIRDHDALKPPHGPVVYVANHMSVLETLLLPVQALLHGRLTFVVKESLLRYPVFSSIMRAVNPVSVARANPREDLKVVLIEGQRRLESGLSVVIFPQATRSAVFNPAEFNSLGAKLAKRAGVPVVPVAVKTDFARNGKWMKDFGRVDRSLPLHFRYGAPLTVGAREREAHEAVVRFITANLKEWGGHVAEVPT